MTREDKQLLLKDLSTRLPYKVVVTDGVEDYVPTSPFLYRYIEMGCKPYLRPMSSMTDEEKEELLNLLFDKEAKYFYIDKEGTIDGKTFDLMKEGFNYPAFCTTNIVLYTDWLNEHHFDYRDLIKKSLAIVAPEGMYKI